MFFLINISGCKCTKKYINVSFFAKKIKDAVLSFKEKI